MRLLPDERRYDRRRQLDAMDPSSQAHEMYREFALLEFPEDLKVAFHLSYCRPLAVPRMARLLAHTGHSQSEPRKRAVDTGLFMYELIEHGVDHERGREVIRALNKMHHRWAIEEADYRYVLSTFAIVPVRWIDQWAWRPSTGGERQACVNFYAEVGRRMNIKDMPPTYEGWAALFDEYEAQHFAYSPEGAALMARVESLIEERLPLPLRRLSGPIMSALLDDRTRSAVGLTEPAPALRASLAAALQLRAAADRRSAPAAAPWFQSGGVVADTYPDGYHLGDLGPATVRAEATPNP